MDECLNISLSRNYGMDEAGDRSQCFCGPHPRHNGLVTITSLLQLFPKKSG